MSRLISFLLLYWREEEKGLRDCVRDGDHEFYGSLSISRGEISRLQGIVLCGKVTRAVRCRGSERPLPRARVSHGRARSRYKASGYRGYPAIVKGERSYAHVSNRFRGVIISLHMQHASWPIMSSL